MWYLLVVNHWGEIVEQKFPTRESAMDRATDILDNTSNRVYLLRTEKSVVSVFEECAIQ